MQSRYYDPEAGRFISPAIESFNPYAINGLNLHAFVGNPVMFAPNSVSSSVSGDYIGGFGLGFSGFYRGIDSFGSGGFFNQVLAKGSFQGSIGYGEGAITAFYREGSGRFEWKIGKQNGKDKFGIKIGYFEKISLLNLNGRIGFGSPNNNIIGFKGVLDVGTGSAFVGLAIDPTNNYYFVGVDLGVAVATGRVGAILGNNVEIGVYGEALGVGIKLGLIFKNGELSFKAGGTFIIGVGFYIRIKLW